MKDKKIIVIALLAIAALLLCCGASAAVYLVVKSRSGDTSSDDKVSEQEESSEEEDEDSTEDDEEDEDDSSDSAGPGEAEEEDDTEEAPSDSVFVNARNTRREADLMTIETAFLMYWSYTGTSIDTLFDIPTCSSSSSYIGTDSGNVDLGSILVDEYLMAMPTDPLEGDQGNTGYAICKTSEGKIRLEAPLAEGKTISREI